MATALSLTSTERAALSSHLASPTPAPPSTSASAPTARQAGAAAAVVPQITGEISANQLPAYIHRDATLAMIREHTVSLLRGSTGCGKSTQVPKCLLLEAAAANAACNIVVTQPRRLAAMSLAERVASELRTDVGGLVGYRIRGESRTSPRTALSFVTTGVLLRQLEEDPELCRMSHVIVDEVHERSVDTDLLLLALRRAIARGTTAKVVLMSATVDAAYAAGSRSLDLWVPSH
jgi:HrpA-like RNA helicase